MVGVDDIKTAAKYFMLAAGVLQAELDLRPQAAFPSSTADASDASLGALRQLMVAQAQACFCEKAAHDKLRSTTQAALCMGARESFAQVDISWHVADPILV